MEFFIIIGAYHSGYNCSGILQISADLVRVNFYGTVYLLRLALFSGLIGIIHHGRYRPVILRDLIQTGGNDQITLIIPAIDPLHKEFVNVRYACLASSTESSFSTPTKWSEVTRQNNMLSWHFSCNATAKSCKIRSPTS